MRVLIVWGSETNNTQGFVNKIADGWKDKHGEQLKTLDVFQGDEIADDEKWDTVTKDNYDFVLICTSSYGEGEPPSGFGRFLYRLQEASKEGEGSGSSQLTSDVQSHESQKQAVCNELLNKPLSSGSCEYKVLVYSSDRTLVWKKSSMK